jgi:nitrogen fixation-related uncharacterized protein
MTGMQAEWVGFLIGIMFLWGLVKVMNGDFYDDNDQHL